MKGVQSLPQFNAVFVDLHYGPNFCRSLVLGRSVRPGACSAEAIALSFDKTTCAYGLSSVSTPPFQSSRLRSYVFRDPHTGERVFPES